MILKFYFIFCAAAIGLFTATVVGVTLHLKKTHPNAKYRKLSFGARLQGLATTISLCICPIFHIFTIGALLFLAQDIFDESVRRMEEKIIDENKKVD